ncbi:MAG: LCP family protein [Anaerolineales bacterium]
MRILQALTFFIVLVTIPATVCGSYLAYTQARQRVAELNEITPLHETDFEQVVRLSVGLDDVDEGASVDVATSTPAPLAMNTSAQPTPVPTEAPDAADTAPTNVTPLPAQASTETVEVAENAEPEAPPIDPRRRNVLLMGIDQREGEEGRFRTDTMIVLSIDPLARTGAMLSIPRDLWVSIPGTGQQGRINTANYVGDDEVLNYPGGGPALAMNTTERLLGISIDHYVQINFTAFTTFIDTLGAVEVCPEERIFDDRYPDGSYGYITIEIPTGCQDMDSTVLLQYARTRATEGSDFDRSRRQQEVILAVRDEILSTGGVSALLGDALTIWESVSENVRTDLTLDEMLALARAAADIQDIRTGTISEGEVLEATDDGGNRILIPIQTDIFSLVADLFRPPNRPVNATAADGPALDPDNLPLAIRQEAPIVEVLNGTEIQGRAAGVQTYLQSYSLDAGFIGNHTTTDLVNTRVVYYGDHAASADYVAQVLATINGNNPPPIEEAAEGSARGDVVIIVGTDLAVPQTAE